MKITIKEIVIDFKSEEERQDLEKMLKAFSESTLKDEIEREMLAGEKQMIRNAMEHLQNRDLVKPNVPEKKEAEVSEPTTVKSDTWVAQVDELIQEPEGGPHNPLGDEMGKILDTDSKDIILDVSSVDANLAPMQPPTEPVPETALPKPKIKKKQKRDFKRKDKIIALHREGKKNFEISKITGAASSYVSTVLTKEKARLIAEGLQEK